MEPTLSFCVTVHNEARELVTLTNKLHDWLKNHPEDELVIIDDYSTDQSTVRLLGELELTYRVIKHKLNGNFAEHKNFANMQCNGNFILQLDADEYPTPTLLENVKDLINLNPLVELFWIPRVNIVRGLTSMDAQKWGWQVYSLNEYPDLPLVNAGDHQGRLYKNDPERIKWVKPVHERIVGANSTTVIPFNPDFAIIHDKTIDKQRSQNELYSKMLTP